MMIKKFTYVALMILSLFCVVCGYVDAQVDWMPDENLRRVVKTHLGIQNQVPLTIQDLQALTALVSIADDIASLKGLEHATRLSFLHIGLSGISDLTPLAGLVQLEVLILHDNQIVDITPLRGLVNLKELKLQYNQITDFSPILELPRLESLNVIGNPGDISEVLTLGFENLGICHIDRPPTDPLVANREYPSIFAAWQNIINLRHQSWEENLAYHDMYLCCPWTGLTWYQTPEGYKLQGDLIAAQHARQEMRDRNPHMLFLVGIYYYGATPDTYPEEWPYWLRDAEGNKVADVGWGEYLIDFTQPGAQDIFVQQAIAVAECGVYDGIFLDWWREDVDWHGLGVEVEAAARVSMLRRIREAVDDDFLILVNTNRSKAIRSAPYINGTFMESFRDNPKGYTYAGLREIEDTLLWAEQSLREPQINCLEGWSIEAEPLDSDRNQRQMRLFTTLSLTHSDGYVSYNAAILPLTHKHTYEIWEGHSEEHAEGNPHDHTHQHYWYDFWDADLGKPIGEKAQPYRNREGVFIREFTNGWAVYNRSGKTQNIQFSEKVSGVASGREEKFWHELPDLDGGIYLKARLETAPADVNGDGIVNILDVVVVANAFGEAVPDLNSDGIVNILDLVIVANAF